MLFNLVMMSAIMLLLLYFSYRRNNLDIDKIIYLKRIWISLLIAILLFTMLQPYISVVLWGVIFIIIRCVDKKDRLLLYTTEWKEYGVPNYKNDEPAMWQNKKQIESLTEKDNQLKQKPILTKQKNQLITNKKDNGKPLSFSYDFNID